MSKEIEFCRRENGLTIRFLAQCLFNDIIFPNQDGINKLMSMARDGSGKAVVKPNDLKWEYWFLFHMEDFESKDKSEIDILLRRGETLFAIEIKAFTDPNAPKVKRELVRNYLKLNEIKENKDLFTPVTDIIPILLYSKEVHLHIHKSAKESRVKDEYNYFNSDFLLKMGYQQRLNMEYPDTKRADVEKTSEKLLFLNWNDVLKAIECLNTNKRFDSTIKEIKSKKDTFKFKCDLVSKNLSQ